MTKIVNKFVNYALFDDFIDSLSCFRTVFRQSGSASTSAPTQAAQAPHLLLTMFKKSWFYSKIFNLSHIIIVGVKNAERSAPGR
jgi:hypothetical protein